ncbi:chitobiosyldiphosphodolichol beta-mannosyltransferase [Condylostylus longicornis]|uniref:chitobiosyldiphosphodolichol beta-mannosyltransferase n=1 Tax=Condylostylus longicornis TaxID=2530218 RepID=UPI00244E1C1A|nr:chitobiosyldiphosphodolichol beta-mannosyltransferase [Condylostylus longicornis]
MTRKRACIVVLGDIGRSPRMQYHAQSLLQENFNVEIIGYSETQILDCLSSSTNQVKIHGLTQFPEINLPSTLKYFFKSIWQSLSLLIALISITRPNFILVQNPPGVPTLVVVWLYCTLTRTHFVIDWHNYTHSILAIGVPSKNNFTIRLAKWIERKFGAKSSANFCVTKAMKEDLRKNFEINATVLYDRAPLQFQPISLKDKHKLFMKMSESYPEFLAKDGRDFQEYGVLESTALTQKFTDGSITYKTDRPAIIVSSTSWTPDEDFGVLLEALEEYENSTKYSAAFPKLLCIITGKGPQKDFYIEKISKMSLSKISIITPWLEMDDYPKVLASADLGICLHWSSSGLDLPMKVVDMFGCGLPVCAINFNCLNELVVDGENGFIFENSKELSDQLKMWFEKFPNNFSLINTKEIFVRNLKEFQSLRWKENWKLNAWPVLNSLSAD